MDKGATRRDGSHRREDATREHDFGRVILIVASLLFRVGVSNGQAGRDVDQTRPDHTLFLN